MAAGAIKGSGLQWFVRHGAAVRGPFSSTRVRHFVLEGKLALDDEVSQDRTDWRRIGTVAEVVPPQMRAEDVALSRDQEAARRGESRRAVRAILVVALVVLVLTVGVSLVGSNETPDQRDCAAAAAPGVMLEACQLSGAQMRGAALNGARMANAILAGALLAESDLSHADLRYADLTGADLAYASLPGADLKGASLRLADLTNTDLSGADLSFADLSGAQLGGARLERTTLNGAIWTDGTRCGNADCPR